MSRRGRYPVFSSDRNRLEKTGCRRAAAHAAPSGYRSYTSSGAPRGRPFERFLIAGLVTILAAVWSGRSLVLFGEEENSTAAISNLWASFFTMDLKIHSSRLKKRPTLLRSG
jgi:hypothetical protein